MEVGFENGSGVIEGGLGAVLKIFCCTPKLEVLLCLLGLEEVVKLIIYGSIFQLFSDTDVAVWRGLWDADHSCSQSDRGGVFAAR